MAKSIKKTLEEKVRHILKLFPETRDDDITLAIKLWKYYHPECFSGNLLKVDALYKLPTQNTISRIRRKIQNEERVFLPTDWGIAKKRKISEQRWKEWSQIKNQAV